MATKPNATTEAVTADQDVETTLLDVQSAAVKRLIAKAKERGYITFDELNTVLPPDQNSSEQIEDVMANFSEMGIQVVESEESEDGEAPVVKTEKTEEPAAKAEVKEAAGLPEGYGSMTIAQLSEAAGGWSRQEVEAALEHERSGKARKGALAALESALEEKK